ncbi:hypothetical protein ACFFSY_04475 [Paenibacillus aurantiacus]|uniref:Transposase n=1 Tax=Paenibacillus aurantiacus TaxID=1936118 RepID=A0ABV5KIX2_9BACL
MSDNSRMACDIRAIWLFAIRPNGGKWTSLRDMNARQILHDFVLTIHN